MILVASEEPACIKDLFDDGQISVQQLDCGDFIVGDMVIERKTVGDFLESIQDGRLHSQRYRLKHCNLKPIIAVVGMRSIKDTVKIGYNSMITAMADLASHGITVINFINDLELVNFLQQLEAKQNMPWNLELSVPKADNINTRLWMCIENISENRAKVLSKEFNFFDIDKLESSQITKLPGFGGKLAKQIKEVPDRCKMENNK